jgi:NADH:ubiquinone oxidoreductase subunit 4 (subunit M)
MLILRMRRWILVSFLVLEKYFLTKLRFLIIWLTCILWAQYSIFNQLLKWNFFLIQFLGLVLLNYFSTYHVWLLLIWFEISLIPIFFILLGYGRQMRRVPATFYFLIYTFCFSLPLFITMLSLKVNFNMIITEHYLRSFTYSVFMLRFLVKLPLFGLHFWLPKVHTESPTLGRMILAAVLLKTGSYGIYLVLKWRKIIISCIWPLIGRSVISVLARIQVDIKKVIAISRISHLNLVLASLVRGRRFGVIAFLLISLTHGFISNNIFYLAGVERKNRRLMYFLKGNLVLNWLLILFLNISHPIRHSILGEGLVFLTLRMTSLVNILTLAVGAFAIIWYRILIWLSLKNQINRNLSISSLILRWYYLRISVIWMNRSVFF